MTNKEILNQMLDNLNEEGLQVVVYLLGDLDKNERYNKNTSIERLEELELEKLQEQAKKEQKRKEKKKAESEFDKQARGIKEILGHQPMKVFVDNLDILEALRRVDTTWQKAGNSFFFEYNTFMYGYVQGIRTERAKKHRASFQ